MIDILLFSVLTVIAVLMIYEIYDKKSKKGIKLGDIYEDCAYHPVLCLESDDDDIAGISLLDGSEPRSCSIKHCGIRKMKSEEVAIRIRNKEDWLNAEKEFQKTLDPSVYAHLQFLGR